MFRAKMAQSAWQFSGIAEPLVEARAWWLAAVLAGTVPLGLGYLLGLWWHQPLAAGLLFLLLLASIRANRPARGMATLALCFAAHNALAIGLAYGDPAGAGAVMPDGQAYYDAQVRWITTGADPEYDWVNWVPAHVHLIAGITLLSVTSLGLLPLVEGVYEVDLMNFYVGNLLANSEQPLTAFFLGWHPWSALRGLCYMVLVYEVASWSLGHLTQRQLSTPSAHRRRWVAALALFAADGVVKLLALDWVRSGLAANFIGSPAWN